MLPYYNGWWIFPNTTSSVNLAPFDGSSLLGPPNKAGIREIDEAITTIPEAEIEAHVPDDSSRDLFIPYSWRSPTTFERVTDHHPKKGHDRRTARCFFFKTKITQKPYSNRPMLNLTLAGKRSCDDSMFFFHLPKEKRWMFTIRRFQPIWKIWVKLDHLPR